MCSRAACCWQQLFVINKLEKLACNYAKFYLSNQLQNLTSKLFYSLILIVEIVKVLAEVTVNQTVVVNKKAL